MLITLTISANQGMQIVGQGDLGQESKEAEVPNQDEFGDLNVDDASNAQAQ